jgi:hypothetical protein
MLTLITTIGTSMYLVASNPVLSMPALRLAKGDLAEPLQEMPMLSTIIVVDGLDSISSSWLQRTVNDMLAKDDVF